MKCLYFIKNILNNEWIDYWQLNVENKEEAENTAEWYNDNSALADYELIDYVIIQNEKNLDKIKGLNK